MKLSENEPICDDYECTLLMNRKCAPRGDPGALVDDFGDCQKSMDFIGNVGVRDDGKSWKMMGSGGGAMHIPA